MYCSLICFDDLLNWVIVNFCIKMKKVTINKMSMDCVPTMTTPYQ